MNALNLYMQRFSEENFFCFICFRGNLQIYFVGHFIWFVEDDKTGLF
jgi:hypothetical protein